MNTASQHVIDALQKIVCCPEHDESLISEYFSPQYQQQVDGKSLDYEGFIRHMALLKQLTTRITVTMLAVAANGEDVLTHHCVEFEKRSGVKGVIDVQAHFTLQDGYIIRCQELTRLVQGMAEDHDLGGRY